MPLERSNTKKNILRIGIIHRNNNGMETIQDILKGCKTLLERHYGAQFKGQTGFSYGF
jgi:hypothetical protein